MHSEFDTEVFPDRASGILFYEKCVCVPIYLSIYLSIYACLSVCTHVRETFK